MKYIKLLEKISNILFLPFLISIVCLLVFRDALNSFRYIQFVRYFLLFIAIIIFLSSILGYVCKKNQRKNEKNN
jgi:uncharacterized membrane protein